MDYLERMEDSARLSIDLVSISLNPEEMTINLTLKVNNQLISNLN